MSNIPEEVEDDPSYRRKMMVFWAHLLKDRDELTRQLNKLVGDMGTIRLEREKVDAVLDRIAEVDTLLGQSRFNRAFEKATVLDRAVVGLESFAKFRLGSFIKSLSSLTVAMMAAAAALVVAEKIVPMLRKWLVGEASFITPAYAASEAINHKRVQRSLYLAGSDWCWLSYLYGLRQWPRCPRIRVPGRPPWTS